MIVRMRADSPVEGCVPLTGDLRWVRGMAADLSPGDAAELVRRMPLAFEIVHVQSINDVVREVDVHTVDVREVDVREVDVHTVDVQSPPFDRAVHSPSQKVK